MSSEERNHSVTVPSELEKILLDYTISVLLEKPDDIVEHAAAYFVNLRDGRRAEGELSEEQSDKRKISSSLGARAFRRGSVVGERFDPSSDERVPEELETYPKNEEERKKIFDRVKDIFLFKVLSEDDLSMVTDAMIPKEVDKGQVIIREGDDGDFFYIVDSGKFAAYIAAREKAVTAYDGRGYFGELALLHNQPRAATVTAESNGRVWAMSRTAFQRLVMRKAYEKRKNYMELLDKVPELKPLSEYDKMQVCDALTCVEVKDGVTVFEEGSDADGMYFVEEGSISIQQKSKSKGLVEVARLEKGEYFGEMALVKKQPRSGSATAVEDTKLAFLQTEAFERLLGPCRDLLDKRITQYSDHHH